MQETEIPIFPKTEKIEIRLRQDLADRLPTTQSERNKFVNCAVANEFAFRKGQMARTLAKQAASRENGKKGGRPKGTTKTTK